MSKKVLSIIAVVIGIILLILDAIWLGLPKHEFNRAYLASVICIIAIVLIVGGGIGVIYYWEE